MKASGDIIDVENIEGGLRVTLIWSQDLWDWLKAQSYYPEEYREGYMKTIMCDIHDNNKATALKIAWG